MYKSSYYSNIGANQPIRAGTINIGCLRGRGSTTRMLNWCQQNSPNPSECINEFVTITPKPSLKLWSQLGNEIFNGPIDSIIAINGKVYADNNILNSSQGYVVVYNNGSWAQVGTGNFTGPVYTIIGNNNYLYVSVGGSSNVNNNYVEIYNNGSWTTGPGFTDAINALAVNTANGYIYAGGNFNNGNIYNNYVAYSTNNGLSWSQLGNTFNNEINALAVDSNNGNVYAGGDFTITPGLGATDYYIAVYNGSSWSQLGTTFKGSIESIVVGNNGYIYAAGFFINGSGNYVAVYNGSTWSPLGNQSFNNTIWALAVDNKGNIYAGGDFTNSYGRYIAVYNGSTWSQLGRNQPFEQTIDTISVDNNGNVYADGYTSQLGNFVAVYSN